MIDYGYKGKCVTTHLITDGNSNPINFEVTSTKGDERRQVEKLLEDIGNFIYQEYVLSGLVLIFEAYKEYDT